MSLHTHTLTFYFFVPYCSPRFLRRTKTDVLTLPPMSEIIIPLSMSSVQKELYKSIVSQNADLMKSITARVEKGAAQPKSTTPKLQNILMQLRKCLAHPFVHSPDLEERNVDFEQEMRALVEASGKLSFLSKLLPKLKEQGHRCLIFSQFLDCLNILEDFLTGIGFTYGRLTGDTATSDRQQMIDAFNAPDSKMDCFLLSTRAGGSGINLGKHSAAYRNNCSHRRYCHRLRSRSQSSSRSSGSC